MKENRVDMEVHRMEPGDKKELFDRLLADIRTFVVNSHQIMVGIRIGEKRLGRSWR